MQGPLASCVHSALFTVNYKDGRTRCKLCTRIRTKELRNNCQRLKRPRCTDPTHVRCPKQKNCITCRQIRDKARYQASRMQEGLIQSGVSPRQIGAKKMWAARKEKYGPSGLRDREKYCEHLRQRPRNTKTHCKYGHLLVGDNLYLRQRELRVERICRRCAERRHKKIQERPEWVIVDNCKVSIETHDSFALTRFAQLRSAMIYAHPDKGGTSHKFIKARKQLQTFVKNEQEWYRRAQMPMPKELIRKGVHASSTAQPSRSV